ncbi:MAG: 3-phosphoglycerate kinase [Planctomycetota bacterium]|jgi:3-phosphoglycerate kinase
MNEFSCLHMFDHLVTKLSELEGKTVLVRSDFNVPLGDDGKVDSYEAWRIDQGLHTIMWLRDHGAKVVVLSHIGRKKDESLRPIAEYINQKIACGFVPEVVGERVASMVARMGNGTVLLLENVRSDQREVQNDISIAFEWASFADFYVNDAFSVAHREHASVVGLPTLLPSYVGIQFSHEVEHLSRVHEPKKPLVLIIGGLKFATKLALIDAYAEQADTVIVGGALAHPIFYAQGFEIGDSAMDEKVDVSHLLQLPNLQVPSEVVIERGFEIHSIPIGEVQIDDVIVDAGYEYIHSLKKIIESAGTILWNGPLGFYEDDYIEGSLELVGLLQESKAYKVVGGGDTVTLLRKYDLAEAFDFVSTAGGAMLDYLVDGSLPAIEALEKSWEKKKQETDMSSLGSEAE